MLLVGFVHALSPSIRGGQYRIGDPVGLLLVLVVCSSDRQFRVEPFVHRSLHCLIATGLL